MRVADPLGDFLELMQLLMGVQYAAMNPASLVKEAAQGHVDNVRRILTQHPTQVRHVTCFTSLFICRFTLARPSTSSLYI